MTFRIRSRKELEEIELKTLAPYARASRGAHATRRFDEPQHPYRTAFQRDRDRIVHSRAFRRLKHKRQVFLTSESDHYRTRITHTLEVSQLSRTIARVLGLNLDLVEAIALGHDLGHTPFGHLGEVILDNIMSGKKMFREQKRSADFGGFKHNYQSVRVVDVLEKKYAFDGLNLTAAVREGILKHTGLRPGQVDYPDFVYDGLYYGQSACTTLEGQVVAICDEIAQRTHDLEDGIRAGLVELEQVRELTIIKQLDANNGLASLFGQNRDLYREAMIRALINTLVDDVLQCTLRNLNRKRLADKRPVVFTEEVVGFSKDIDPLQRELNKFIYREIINFSRVNWSDELAGKLIFRLFEAYYHEPHLLPDYLLQHYLRRPTAENISFSAHELQEMQNDPRYFRLVCDYIAGMTDFFALREAEKLAGQQKIPVDDLHLETAFGNHPDAL